MTAGESDDSEQAGNGERLSSLKRSVECHNGRTMAANKMRSNRTNIRKGVALFI